MTAVGKFNPNSVIKEYTKGLDFMPTNDRHIMLTDIRLNIGPEEFSNWYDGVYELRKAGKKDEYEQAIKDTFEFLRNADALHELIEYVNTDPAHIRTSAEVDPRTPEQRKEDEELADQLATYNDLRMSGCPF